jgi:valine--pyruvate aminotransferase
VLTDDEVARLDQVARENNIPLILDCAYGTPFPNLIFTEARPIWNDNIIACFSLSKLGLPAARTGIVVANAEVIKALSAVNGIMNLATGSFGAMLAQDMVRSGEILRISNTIVRPFYLDKAKRAEACLRQYLQGTPFALHKAEGAMFLWLWLRDCPVTSQALYERLKSRGVLVVPGHHFFPGLESGEDKNWRHKHECLRITYSQDDALVERGLAIIGEEVKKAYAE